MEDTITWLTLLIGGGSVLLTILISLCVMVPVLGLVVWVGLRLVRNIDSGSKLNQAAMTWPSVPGKVIQSRVEVHSGPDHTIVQPKIVYEYEVNDTKYQNDTIRAGDKFMRVSNSQEAYTLVDQHPVGTEIAVYYNPVNPAQSTLIRGQAQIQLWSSRVS